MVRALMLMELAVLFVSVAVCEGLVVPAGSVGNTISNGERLTAVTPVPERGIRVVATVPLSVRMTAPVSGARKAGV
jgi:hypothetical protein